MSETAYYERIVQQDLNVGTSTAAVRNPGGGSNVGTQIGIHSLALGQAAVTATWDPGTIPASNCVSTTVSVSGAAVGDFVLVSHDQIGTATLNLTGHVQATGIVRAVLDNPTSDPVTVASGTLRVLVLQSR